MLRNVAGLTGIGLLCAAVLGGGLAWAGPLAYMVVAAYELYAAWHGGGLDHAVDLAGPAAARCRRRDLRRLVLRRRDIGHHRAWARDPAGEAV